MKIVGAWMIAWGLFSLMIGFIGLRVGWLFFLDEFGPVMAYVLKIGLIVAGIWVWRRDGRERVTEGEQSDAEAKRAWVPVILSGTVVVGVVVFIAASVRKDRRLHNQINQTVAPATWAATPPNRWPDLVLLQRVKFAHHSGMEAGCACLVRLPTGEIVALTAGHLLGRAGGVNPGFTHGGLGGLDQRKLATLTAEITSWRLFPPDDEGVAAKVIGLYGEPAKYGERCDQVLLQVLPDAAGYPATPLDVRLKPVAAEEPLQVITFGMDRRGNLRQVTYHAKRLPSPFFTCALDRPADLNGCSGAPVVDKDGLLVAIVTGGTLMDLNDPTGWARSFSGRTIGELLPVLKAEVAKKGIAPPSPAAKVIVHPAKKLRSPDDVETRPGAASNEV